MVLVICFEFFRRDNQRVFKLIVVFLKFYFRDLKNLLYNKIDEKKKFFSFKIIELEDYIKIKYRQ